MERVEDGSSMNVVPPMFHAGISNKFTKRHIGNFRDTTLTAASAAKQRAERKLERQADAIEKQQQKIDNEMKKIADITQNLHRQQLREAKRLRNRMNYAASKIQGAYWRRLAHINRVRRDAAVVIQCLSRCFLARRCCGRLRLELELYQQNSSSLIISRCIRRFAARSIRAREVELRYWAACTIQSMGRMLAARSYVRMERQQRGEAELQHRAAVVIQCNARSFMTRLIYLDVLYLICRIQAAMRGCLVRKQLRWIRASDVEGISKLQAHVRGYLVRRRIAFVQESIESDINLSVPASNLSNYEDVGKADQATQADFGTSVPRLGETSNHANGGYRSTRASSFSFKSDGKNGRNNLAKSLTGLGWQPSVEPAIKRSYWLPAGASFDRRLPVLPVPKRMLALERVCADSGDPLGGDEQRLINQSWTPKKRPHQKPCPVRLSPVVIPSVRPEVPEINLNEDAVNENANLFEKEERIRRQEELKQKLQSRRNQEKRQQKLELKLKGEAENEAKERKMMEREEKSIRLQLKILRRRSKEGKIRQVSADQRREERERIAMTREERHIRLHIKFCSRQVSKKRQQLATASTTASESESQPSSTKQTRRDSSIAKARKTTSRSKREDGASSDDDGDMSFLDIDFTIPAAMKPRNQAGSNTGNSQTKKPRGSSKHTLTKKQKKAPGRGKCNRDNTCEAVPLSVQEDQEDDCGYGDEFDDVEDEVALGSLIC